MDHSPVSLNLHNY